MAKRRPIPTKEDEKRILAMRQDMTVNEIWKATGFARHHVSRICRALPRHIEASIENGDVLSATQLTDICDRARRGETSAQIARQFLISPRYVAQLTQHIAVERRADRNRRMIEARLAGQTTFVIADTFGVSRHQVSRITKHAVAQGLAA